MAQLRITPDTRITVSETFGEIAIKLVEIIKDQKRFIHLTEFVSIESGHETRQEKEPIIINIDHIIMIY